MTTENPMLTMIREVCSLGRAEFARPRTVDGDNSAQRTLVAGLLATDPEGNPSDISLSLDPSPREPPTSTGSSCSPSVTASPRS